jgi:hypothetical protein
MTCATCPPTPPAHPGTNRTSGVPRHKRAFISLARAQAGDISAAPGVRCKIGKRHLSEASVAGNGVNDVGEHLADALRNVVRVGRTALPLGLPRARQKGLRFEQELAPDGLGVGRQQPSQRINVGRLALHARHKSDKGRRPFRSMRA